MNIQINDGKKTFEIKNQDGELLGTIRFNPTDTNIIRKYESVARDIAALKDTEITTDAFVEAEDKVKNSINELFGSDVSTMLFSVAGVFTVMESGEVYAQHVLDALFKTAKEEIDKNSEVARNKMNDYLEDYSNA